MRGSAAPQNTPRAFTLVELLVVITIIAILASLITVAAVGAMRAAKEARITVEINQLSAAFEDYKNDVSGGAYPPNGMVPASPSNTLANRVSNDLVRHFKKAFPRHREPEGLIRGLAGDPTTATYAGNVVALPGGMSSSEAIVFWLGGFSSDPKYPISGAGGPAFLVTNQEDFASRNRTFDFDIGRLGPRVDPPNDNNFDGRFIEYDNPLPNGGRLRINLWQYAPSGSTQPYVYFDTSSTPLPFSTDSNSGDGPLDVEPVTEPHAHPIKRLKDGAQNITLDQIQYANDDKFQILHCGIDDDWGEMDALSTADGTIKSDPSNILLYPLGPFTGALADTLTNFTEGTLEDAQP